MSVPLEAAVSCDEKLAAPDLPVRAVTCAVECDADDVAFEAVLRHAARDMRVVMLHGDAPDVFETERPLRALVKRMQVVRDDARYHSEKLLEVRECLFEEA